jgi:hypothetical protein
MTARLWALGLAALPLVACKPNKEGSRAPHRDVHGWTLAEIEAELARNDAVLAGEGIMVAVAPTIAPPDGPGMEVVPPVTEPEGETTDPEPGVDIDDGSEPGEDPEISPPEPMPTARPEPQPVYGGAEEPMETSVAPDSAAERRVGKRRLSSRSRREANSRCDRLCGLAEATCELETQICELSARHPGEPRYQQACLRAEQQCIAASDACQRCEE